MLGVNVSVKSSQPSALSTATVQYQAEFSLDCKMFCGLLKCKLDFQHRNLNVELGLAINQRLQAAVVLTVGSVLRGRILNYTVFIGC